MNEKKCEINWKQKFYIKLIKLTSNDACRYETVWRSFFSWRFGSNSFQNFSCFFCCKLKTERRQGEQQNFATLWKLFSFVLIFIESFSAFQFKFFCRYNQSKITSAANIKNFLNAFIFSWKENIKATLIKHLWATQKNPAFVYWISHFVHPHAENGHNAISHIWVGLSSFLCFFYILNDFIITHASDKHTWDEFILIFLSFCLCALCCKNENISPVLENLMQPRETESVCTMYEMM